MKTITHTNCTECQNSIYFAGSDTLTCTNCYTEKKRVTRKDNAFMVTATSSHWMDSTLILTSTGWVDMVGCDTKNIYHKRQGKTLKEFINNPPYGYTVKIDML